MTLTDRAKGPLVALLFTAAAMLAPLEGARAATLGNASDLSATAVVVTQGTWQTSLLPRDWAGNGVGIDAYYDPFLNLTWLADPDFARSSGFDSDGLMTFAVAKAWATGLTLFGGNDWRLPMMSPVSGLPLFNNNFSNNGTTDHGTAATGVGWGRASEMGYMYYVHLGNKGVFAPNNANPSAAGAAQPGFGLSNQGPFLTLRPDVYTTGVEVGAVGSVGFGFQNGFQSSNGRQDSPTRAWAVHPGDVIGPRPGPLQPVPLPGGLVLLGSALAGVWAAQARRRGARAGS